MFKNFESKTVEAICIELTISIKKWCVLFAYCPPSLERNSFFEKILSSLSLIINQHENTIVTGDLNIRVLDLIRDTKNNFYDLRDIFALTNLVKGETCFKNKSGTLLEVILINRSNCFQNIVISKTGLSDFHKLVTTIFRSTFIKLPPKTIRYRSFKTLNKQNFFQELGYK